MGDFNVFRKVCARIDGFDARAPDVFNSWLAGKKQMIWLLQGFSLFVPIKEEFQETTKRN